MPTPLPDGWQDWPAEAKQKLLDELRSLAVRKDVFGALGYVPTDRQSEFHAATEFDVLFGGAAGGGKSKCAVADDLRDAIRYPGIRIGCFRRTYPELEESVLKELAGFSYGAALGARWNGGQHELRFPNKSVIRYGYLESAIDASRRQGGEYQKLTIDERGLMLPDVVEHLMERVRSGRKDIPVLGVRSTTNPGGAGHAHLKERFVKGTDYGQHVYTDPHGRSVRFIPAKVDDNPHVDPEYRSRLEAIPDPARRAAMLDGDWDIFAGMFFAEWRRELHVVDPLPIPKEWKRYAGIDFGYAAPWCCLWAAVDQDKRIWVYRELYEKQRTEAQQANGIIAAEVLDAPVARRFADPSMWAKTGSAPSVAQAYSTAGVRIEKAVNDREIGWQRMHSVLALGPACTLHRDQGLELCPMMHITTGCPNLLRTLPSLPYDARKPEDLDTHAEDHAADALRYLVMGASGASRPATVSTASRARIPIGTAARR